MLIMKTVMCSDGGFDCAAIMKVDAEQCWRTCDEKTYYKIEDLTPELKQKIRGLIHSS
jgi:hypothetical protein